jgi:hypothetical protein
LERNASPQDGQSKAKPIKIAPTRTGRSPRRARLL